MPRSLVIYSTFHNRLTSHPYGGHQQHKSRHLFAPAALELLRDASELSTSEARWADYKWSIEWRKGTSRLHSFFDDVDALPPGMGLPKPAWVRLNRLRTGVGLYRSLMHKWSMASSASCTCGVEEHTADHIITSCPIYRHPNRNRGLLTVNESLARWLSDTCPAIQSDATSRCNIAPIRKRRFLLITCPYHLTPFAFAILFNVSFKPNVSTSSSVFFLSTNFTPYIDLTMALSVLFKIAISLSHKNHVFHIT